MVHQPAVTTYHELSADSFHAQPLLVTRASCAGAGAPWLRICSAHHPPAAAQHRIPPSSLLLERKYPNKKTLPLRLELRTSRLTALRSDQLSYGRCSHSTPVVSIMNSSYVPYHSTRANTFAPRAAVCAGWSAGWFVYQSSLSCAPQLCCGTQINQTNPWLGATAGLLPPKPSPFLSRAPLMILRSARGE